MPSVPSAATPPYSPPTLPTHHKGGLNHLCASVFPQCDKGEFGGVVVVVTWGCHNKHTCKKTFFKQHNVVYVEIKQTTAMEAQAMSFFTCKMIRLGSNYNA